MYLSRGYYEYLERSSSNRQHTETQTNDSEDSLDTCNSLTTQKLAIVETNITRWTLYDQGRGGWRRRRREGIVVGRSVDVNVAKRKKSTHVVWMDMEMRQED
jgi:hypothetical protein